MTPLGGDGNGVLFKDYCWQQWKDKYDTSPPWGKKEFSQLHECRLRFDTEELARATWDTFMKSNEVFHEGHSPGQFIYGLSRMTARAVKAIPKKEAQVQGELVSDHLRIMREVYNDPKFPSRQEKHDETQRRLREL